jgi:branched-chain amino acid transport system permease protein
MKKYLPFIIVGLLAVLPLIGLSSYVMHILIIVIMWSVIGMAWNLLGGYSGSVPRTW